VAGHENSLVRPKEFIQDPLKIAAGSPLAIQGVFLEIIRERFRADSGLGIVWQPDITETDVVIEVGFNEETESRSQTPAIYINKQDTVPAKIMVGDRAGVSLPDHCEGFAAITTVGIVIDCVSNDEGESAIVGDIVQYMLLASQDVIQREFGFYDMSQPSLSATEPYDRDTKKWNTQVQFQVQFWIRWSQVPIRPLLQQIATRITAQGNDAAGFFHDITINSLRRGEVLDPATQIPGAELPPSRVSIVGPPGPAGPAGPPGPAGAPGATVLLLIDQPLTGVQNGINKVFTTSLKFSHSATQKEMVYFNGIRQKEGVGCDYIASESIPLAGYDTLTFDAAPRANDVLTIDFYENVP
jgi:hypothetical protein